MFAEQFIQDAICRPERIARVVHEIGKTDWVFDKDKDVVNQEFNFSVSGEGGRIDVLATFNGCRKLLIVEVKAGSVGDAELQQLTWYLDNWKRLQDADKRLAQVDEAVGVLLADAFLPIKPGSLPGNARLVKFELASGKFPFSVHPPELSSTESETQTSVLKHSRLASMANHREYLVEPKLRQAFDGFVTCFLDEDDKRSDWVCQNPKGGHVAVHYKGYYIIYVFVQKKSFDVGYTKVDGNDVRVRFTAAEADGSLQFDAMKSDVLALLDHIDSQMQKVIPSDFSWGSV